MESVPYFCGETLDDVMKMSIEAILKNGIRVKSNRGDNIELTGIMLEIRNPRARISRTEMRGKPFSCFGELLWYLRRTNALNVIEYYIRQYKKESDDGATVHGGYGPRLFEWKEINQFENVSKRLINNPGTRKAVIQLFDGRDLIGTHKDVPCTCTLQFFIRNNCLHMFTSMRSNDAYLGLPHDVFSFTMLQEIMARTVGVEIGTYKHSVGSFHLYNENIADAESFLKEGWQSTQNPMPPMPEENPWSAIDLLLEAESCIRCGGVEAFTIPQSLHSYWGDLIRLLQLFRLFKDKDTSRIKMIQSGLCCGIYNPFINKKFDELSNT